MQFIHAYCDATRLPQWPIALPGPSFLTARRVLRLFSPLSGVRNPQSLPLALLPLSYTQESDSGPRFSRVRTSNVHFPDPRDPRKVNVDFLHALRRSGGGGLLTRSRTLKSRGTDLATSLSRSFAPLPLVLLIPRYRRPEARVPPKELSRPRDCSAQQVDSVVDGIHSQVPLRLSLFL
jgi:hypothetical protein